MKRSAGILLYKKENDQYLVLLTHFGGPYWEKQDKGAWSVQKGIVEKGEKVLDAAKREVEEETNIEVCNDIYFLASKKVTKNKLAIMFYSYYDGDISNFKSNTFQLEWPSKSNKIVDFPEMDKIEWFTLKDAKEYIYPVQRFFIERLEEKLKKGEI
ncbi:MAG TPA: NUDIX domain-containing protein [Candidatus Faecimonas gallistercoris]|nr:NUDIX domain-containing protein [Candidatus Faecimonas gallistercoris]